VLISGRGTDVPFCSITRPPFRFERAWRLHRGCPTLIGTLVAALAAETSGARGQEPSPKREPIPASSPAGNQATKADEARAARQIPDALKFANGLLRQRKYDLAAEEFAGFLKSSPGGQDGVDARFGLANCRLHQGRYQDAWHAFDEFLKAAPNDSRALTARYRLGELSYLLGDLAAARKSLEAFTQIKVQHAGLETAWTYLGDTCFGLGDLPGARKAYERSLADFPRGRMADRARYGLGRTLAGLGERDRALSVLQELARKAAPDWVDRSWFQIGLIRKSAGQFAEAVEAFNTLETAAPGSALRAEAQLQRALVLIHLGRSGEAQSILRTLADKAPEPMGPRAALELATIELEQNHPESASATLEGALKRFPKSPSTPALLFRSAEALQKREKRADAKARFLQVLDADPADPWADDALQRAAQLALEIGDPATARRLAGSFAGRFPASALQAEVRLIEARATMQTGNPKEAAVILESLLDPPAGTPRNQGPKAEKLPPPLAQAARYDLALAYRATGQSARADAVLAEVARGPSEPIAADAQFLIGQGQLDNGRYADAIASLERYLAAKPSGDVADFALAHLVTARLELHQDDAASKTLADLAARFPRSQALAPTRIRLAEAALAAHQPVRAAELYRLVAGSPTEQAPAKPSTDKPGPAIDRALRVRALAGLGTALWELDNPAEAAAAFGALLDLAPDDPIAPEIALARGRALVASGQPVAALKAYSLVAERFAKSGQALQASLAQARLLGEAGRHAEASRTFERLLDGDEALKRLQAAGVAPDTVLVEWGRALVDGEKTAEADAVFKRLMDEYPDSAFAAEARFNLAESANVAHNHAEVVRLLAPLIKPNARPADPKDAGEKSRAAGSTATDATAPEPLRRLLPAVLYRLGRTQVEMSDWDVARATLDRLIAEFPGSPYRREAIYLRAESALQTGDAAAAERGFASLLSEPPSANDSKGLIQGVRLKRIHCWVAMKRWKDALDAAKTLRSGLAPGDPSLNELDFLTGQALLGLARLDEARALFQSVVDAHPGADMEAHAQLMCGETYFHQNQFHEALRIFLKVDILYDAPRWQAASLLEAGKVYERLDQWADAAETYERLLNRFPKQPSASEARDRSTAAGRRAAGSNSGKKS
jgi:TolA-binding protein